MNERMNERIMYDLRTEGYDDEDGAFMYSLFFYVCKEECMYVCMYVFYK